MKKNIGLKERFKKLKQRFYGIMAKIEDTKTARRIEASKPYKKAVKYARSHPRLVRTVSTGAGLAAGIVAAAPTPALVAEVGAYGAGAGLGFGAWASSKYKNYNRKLKKTMKRKQMRALGTLRK